MDFNSLDAQREACEAYIKSQRHEGWELVPEEYSDGGFSGGNLERPGLKKLLVHIEAGLIDIIVCYKLDRLSRSLLDFAQLIRLFEGYGVSFVSVTQAFSTKTSMGRLTLNMLLSFAQFERDLISERTSDKMSAARRKGKWTGGTPVLGYDVAKEGGKIIVNSEEARQVRAIYDLYLSHRSLTQTARELNQRGWCTKTWRTKKGHIHHGKRFSKTNLSALLSNVLYVGKISLRGEVFEGEHQAIIDEEVFEQVQAVLKLNRTWGWSSDCGYGNNGDCDSGGGSGSQKNGPQPRPRPRIKHGALLGGLLFCQSCNTAMTLSSTTKKNKRYRYYVCTRAQKEGYQSCSSPTKSLPAADIEKFVVNKIGEIGKNKDLLKETCHQAKQEQKRRITHLEKEAQYLEKDLRRVNRKMGAMAGKIDNSSCSGGISNNVGGDGGGGGATRYSSGNMSRGRDDNIPGNSESITVAVPTTTAVSHLTDLQEQMANLQRQRLEIQEQLQHLRAGEKKINPNALGKALRQFTPIWDVLTPRERSRLLNLLITRVSFDGQSKKIFITFSPEGMELFANANTNANVNSNTNAAANANPIIGTAANTNTNTNDTAVNKSKIKTGDNRNRNRRNNSGTNSGT